MKYFSTVSFDKHEQNWICVYGNAKSAMIKIALNQTTFKSTKAKIYFWLWQGDESDKKDTDVS
ncbi:hypothetical protein AO385_1329 [Moraxella catarrhalis]|uniref:Uncharacterized protein n=1 Tax=Moraxella catarrhalis TaxID=480 RepID=A0A198UJB8_MORCA|nr:hypothetical protein AO384_1062 [Moraxella catarrhalis]OAU97177.1 hypothetical protein AO383_1058 [Moraxella catarrhalis]OAU99721.1 hypothetical protein AO385_1329 [Moraxella catarrhalis]